MPAGLGQQWEGLFQIGKETTAGVAVPATRIQYFDPADNLTITQDPRPHRFQVGRRDNVLAYTSGPVQAAGSVQIPMSASEAIELFLMAVQGGVTPTTPTGAVAGRKWIFKPGGNTDSVTLEWKDGANLWQGLGYKGNNLKISGSVDGTNMVSLDLFGVNLVTLGSLTGALSQRVPNFSEGWQGHFYCDAFGSAPGVTQIPGVLKNWDLTLGNNLDRSYTLDMTLAANRVTTGQIDLTANLTFDAATAYALAEFANWQAGTKRVIRLEFMNAASQLEAAINEIQTINTTGVPTGGTFTAVVLGQTTGTIAFNATSGAVQTAINAALAVLGTGYTVTCAGGPVTTAPVTVTFTGAAVAGRDIPQIALGTNSLTGGTTPAPVFATTTPGYYGGEIVQIDLPGAWTATDLSGNANGIRTYQMTLQAVYEPTVLAAMMAITCFNSRATSY
jgi:hypothetical protein